MKNGDNIVTNENQCKAFVKGIVDNMFGGKDMHYKEILILIAILHLSR